MKLVSVSVVKNEADIIEPFVRHTLAWVDHCLICDHASTDGTREILSALQAEGLPISLFADDALGKLQQRRSNHLTRLAAAEQQADWILPLDADEILTGPDRVTLEQVLAKADGRTAATIPLLNYYATIDDDPQTTNPVLRLCYCDSRPSATIKVLIPRALARDETVVAGMGSHALLHNGQPLAGCPLPSTFWLSHLARRSPVQQAARVVLAELQKLSRGRKHEGLDVHYRLGFQLLAEDPDLFFATINPPTDKLRRLPIEYRGAPLRHGAAANDWNRVVRALLPFLEKMAASHGALSDSSATTTGDDEAPPLRKIGSGAFAPNPPIGRAGAFGGFTAVDGWAPQEGPLPAAFLPRFHWGLAPQTVLRIDREQAGPADFEAAALTYSEGQALDLELNGTFVKQFHFLRTNQKQLLTARLPLRSGENTLVLRYRHSLQPERDPRRLAVIFLSLRIQP